MVLVSLLVDQLSSLFLSLATSMYFWSVSLVYQLSGQFHIFLVDQIFFWYTKYFFGRPNFFFGRPNFFLVYQNIFLLYQKFFWSTKFFFDRPKKWEIDRTIGIPKRLTKSTWTPLLCRVSDTVRHQGSPVCLFCLLLLFGNLDYMQTWELVIYSRGVIPKVAKSKEGGFITLRREVDM